MNKSKICVHLYRKKQILKSQKAEIRPNSLTIQQIDTNKTIQKIEQNKKTAIAVSHCRRLCRKNQFQRHRRLPGTCLLRFLHPDLLCQPDQKGDHQYLHCRCDDRLDQKESGDLFHRKAAGSGKIRKSGAH